MSDCIPEKLHPTVVVTTQGGIARASTMGYMNPETKNNDRLRELVEASGLTQAAALDVFNKGLGPAAYSINTFKAFLASPTTTKFRALKDDLLAHAEKNFKQHAKST